MKKCVAALLAMFSIAAFAATEVVDGIEWNYEVRGGAAVIGRQDSSQMVGAITIPSSLGGCTVTGIGDDAFYNCSGLTSVTIPSGVTSIGVYAFSRCSGLTSVTIPSGVTNIGWSAFCGCSGLTRVTIPSSVTSIGGCAFYDTPFYDNLPNGLIVLGSVAYKYKGECPASVKIPDGVSSIGYDAFYGCSGLTRVTIPSSVTSIGDEAFSGCSGLASVTIPSSVTTIGRSAFCGCSGLTRVTIPSSVTSIDNEAFSGCSGLTSVTIPSNVTVIGSDAFHGCSGLTSVAIPSSVTHIGAHAFEDCYGLKTVYVEDGNEQLVSEMFANAGADVSAIDFVVRRGGEGSGGGVTADFNGDVKRVFNGLVYRDGSMCGMIQITTAKASKKGVKVGGSVILLDGKKQTIKAVTVPIVDGYLTGSAKVGKLGDLNFTIGGNGFKGELADMTVASADVGENTGILKATIKMSYFDAKTGKLKTKSIQLGGMTTGEEAVGTVTTKGKSEKTFFAELD